MMEDAESTLAAAAAALPREVPVERHVLVDDSPAAALDALAAAQEADLIVLGSTHRHKLGRLTGRTTVQRLLQGAPCAVAVAAPDQSARFGEHPRLCVAYDGSPESEEAVKAAFAIAAATGAGVTLARVVEPIIYAAGYAPVPVDLDVEADMRKQAASALAAVAGRAPAGVVVDQRLLFGAVAHSVLEVARDGCDLIVAGSRHYGPLHRVFAGSVSTQLLTDGHIPVLVTARGTHGDADAAAGTEAQEPAIS